MPDGKPGYEWRGDPEFHEDGGWKELDGSDCYLRADLKCGECGGMTHEKTSYGDTTFCKRDKWRNGLRDKASPACMAFVPKESL
jgi:hypothetical protein